MQVSEIRRQIAPMFGLTDESLRKKQDELYRQPSLREHLPGRRAAGSDLEGLRATASATALVLLTGMLGYSRDKIGPEVVRMWEAPPVATGGVRPMAGIELCGAGLILLLEHAQVRAHLDTLELDLDVPQLAFNWKDGRRTIFAPYTAREWRKRVTEVAQRDLYRKNFLPGGSVEKIAALIAQ